jgi:hypothetical protein
MSELAKLARWRRGGDLAPFSAVKMASQDRGGLRGAELVDRVAAQEGGAARAAIVGAAAGAASPKPTEEPEGDRAPENSADLAWWARCVRPSRRVVGPTQPILASNRLVALPGTLTPNSQRSTYQFWTRPLSARHEERWMAERQVLHALQHLPALTRSAHKTPRLEMHVCSFWHFLEFRAPS